MGTALIVLFGILLPLVTLAVEFSNGMCAQHYVDPLLTPGHVLLVALVPLANLAALVGAMASWTKARGILLWANGVALGIALLYTLVFLPLTPFAVIAIVVWGMGLLPLAPLCSLLCAMALRRRLMRMSAAEPSTTAPQPNGAMASLLLGGLLGMLLLAAAESTVVVTRFGVEMALSESPNRRAKGLALLRRFGNQTELLRLCYQENSHSMSGNLFPRVPHERAQEVFFCVMGQPYNALPAPTTFLRQVRGEFDFDPDVGGQAVAGRRKGLTLDSSQIDVQLHADAALAYTEWTMVFRNDHPQQREARAQVLLPPGGVVSRVTLWVNGEPREAAFAGASQVREAYQRVAVVQRRDPLLVTWAGTDRVLAQCFPVPPHGEMKIRLGITAPVAITKEDACALRLPALVERNFTISDPSIHSVWVESDGPIHATASAIKKETLDDSRYALRGALSDEELSSNFAMILSGRSAAVAESWTPELKDPKKHVVQKVVTAQPAAKRKIVVVVDGSVGMADRFDAIGELIAGVSDKAELHVLVAADTVLDLSAVDRGFLGKRLHAVAGVGGCDNVPALRQAFEMAAGSGDKAIVWLHGPQPVRLQSAAPLAHVLERGGHVEFDDFAVVGGPNRVVEELGTIAALQPSPRLGVWRDDLKDLLARLTGQAKQYRLERALLEGDPPSSPQASPHLARLWANDQVLRHVRSGKAAELVQARSLAAAHLLVTPVTGAVVLETV